MQETQKPSAMAAIARKVNKVVDINGRYYRAAGGESRPAFYNIDETYPCLRVLDQNYDVISKEMEGILGGRIPRYHDVAPSETYISGTVDADKTWKVFMLRSMAGDPTENQARCPKTMELINKIPNVYQAFFSILEAGKSIPAHSGTYLGYLRYHLGLRVPKNNPPSMRVKDEIHTWQEGKSILFDDSWEHEVYNKSDGLRVVLILDFLRPLPMSLHAANWAITRLLMRNSEEGKQFMAQVKKHSQG